MAVNKLNKQKDSFREFDFFFGDKLAKYIIEKKRWSYSKTGSFALLLHILTTLLVAIFSGTLLPNLNFRSLLEDYWVWVTIITLVPTVWIGYVWSYKVPKGIFVRLEEDGIISLSNMDTKKINRIFKSRWQVSLAILIGITFMVLFDIMGALNPTRIWWNITILNQVLVALINLPVVTVTFLLIFRVITINRIIYYAMKNINVKPLHPDQAGGLLPVGNFVVATLYPIALFGSISAFSIFWLSFVNDQFAGIAFNTAIILYLIVVPIIFSSHCFLPTKECASLEIKSFQKFLSSLTNNFQLLC